MNRYLVIAWITSALSLLSAGALMAMSITAHALKAGDLSVPWLNVYVALISVWALMPIVLRRPVLGLGRSPIGYAPRRSLVLIVVVGLLFAIRIAWLSIEFMAHSDDLGGAVFHLVDLLRMFTMWMWMLAITAFAAWHNDPAWGTANDIVPSLPRLAGKFVRRLTMGRASAQ